MSTSGCLKLQLRVILTNCSFIVNRVVSKFAEYITKGHFAFAEGAAMIMFLAEISHLQWTVRGKLNLADVRLSCADTLRPF